MTTNQTIDGVLVPRELLSYWAECLESAGFKDRPAEMRALLDAPAKDYVMINNMYFSHAEILEWREKACMELEAAQTQGEPVAWMQPNQGGMCISNEVKQHSIKLGGAPASAVAGYSVPLYAEQPAPVAAVLPMRALDREDGAFFDKGWNACLDQLKRLNPSL